MSLDVTIAGDWSVVARLYEDLARVERRAPGSDAARDLEEAITLLLDGRCTGSDRRYRQRDAVRRARFLRLQAARQRATVLARVGDVNRGRWTRSSQTDEAQPPTVSTSTPEDVACVQETLRELLSGARTAAAARRTAGVLAGLLADRPAAEIAGVLGVSRSTVDRCIHAIRTRTRSLLASWVAA